MPGSEDPLLINKGSFLSLCILLYVNVYQFMANFYTNIKVKLSKHNLEKRSFHIFQMSKRRIHVHVAYGNIDIDYKKRMVIKRIFIHSRKNRRVKLYFLNDNVYYISENACFTTLVIFKYKINS